MRLHSALAIAMLGNACASSSASFAKTSHPTKYVVDQNLAFAVSTKKPTSSIYKQNHNFSTMRQAIPLMSPSALNMAEEKDYVSPMRQRPRPEGGDVAYANENIMRQSRFYNNIRKVGGKDCVQDIYARDPNTMGENVKYWFVGKVARCTGTVSPGLAIARQINLIEEHACRIRPVELGRYFGSLEFYSAPGDTEPLTSTNDPGIRLEKVERNVEGSEKVPLLEVGLNLEIVTNQGAGFFVVRTEDGVVPPHLIGM